jgi:hypothetical protein
MPKTPAVTPVNPEGAGRIKPGFVALQGTDTAVTEPAKTSSRALRFADDRELLVAAARSGVRRTRMRNP